MRDQGHNFIVRELLRYAARGLRRSPGFSAIAVLTLALGMGATTAIFGVLYGVLLKPLSFEEPDRLVALYHLMPGFGPGRKGPQSAATYFTYRDHARVFEDIGLWNLDEVTVTSSGTPERVQALRLTDGVLPLLRVRSVMGGPFRKEDDVPGAPNRVLLTYRYWQSAFGGAPDVVGRSLVVNEAPYEIIGILPASFKFLNTHPQMVLPLRLNRAQALTGSGFGPHGVARLRPGVTLSQANVDIARIIPLVVEQFPLPPGITRKMWESVGLSPNVRPLSDEVIGDVGRFLWILLGTAGIVLLMACVNVANLLLVRGEERQREFAVRGALGASGGRISGELLSESLLLGLAGGAVGVLFAQAGLSVLRRMAPIELPRVDEIDIDSVVLVFTVTMSVVTAMIFGLLPALKFGRFNFHALRDGGRSTSGAPGRHRTRNTLVVAQVALALVLLIVSALMIRTFFVMRDVQPGFVRPTEVQTFRIALPPLMRDPLKAARTHEQIAERLKQVSGVVAVGLTSKITMDGSPSGAPIFVKDRPSNGTPPIRRSKIIAPGYFETMGNPVLQGRGLTWIDVFEPKAVVFVTVNLAREYWGEPALALGKRIGPTPEGPWSEIVGVAGNERDDGLNQEPPPLVYWPMEVEEFARRNMAYVVRSPRVGTPEFPRELQRAVWSINPNLALGHLQTLDQIQRDSMAQTSFATAMLVIAAGVALLLGLVGIYGVVSHTVAERTNEIGIRMALGAQSADVRLLFLRHGVAMTLAGIILGLALVMLVTPIISALLYGVGPIDPFMYAGVSIALGAVTLLATYLPVRRASRVQPIVALRSGE